MGQPTTRLLKYSPLEAILLLINNHFNMYLRPEFVRVGEPVMVSGKLTEVDVSITQSSDESITSPYIGSMKYRYERLDVSEVLDDLHFDIAAPTTVGEVLNRLSARTGLVISPDDFIQESITDNEHILKSNPISLRWVGQVTITIGSQE